MTHELPDHPNGSDLLQELPYPFSVSAQDLVTVRFFAAARAAAGCDQMTVEPGPLEQVLESMHAAFPALAAVTPMCSFLVDSMSAKRLGGGTEVSAGSTVDVLPPFAGG